MQDPATFKVWDAAGTPQVTKTAGAIVGT